VKNRVHFFWRKPFQLCAQIRRRGENFHALRRVRRNTSPFADEQIILCPRAARKLASSVPSRPVEKFVSRRTSSSGSNVGPAVTMQFMPCKLTMNGQAKDMKKFRQAAKQLLSFKGIEKFVFIRVHSWFNPRRT
jgi:hypothetical protein